MEKGPKTSSRRLAKLKTSKKGAANWQQQEAEEQSRKISRKERCPHRKVKARYKVWPSAYASGVQCSVPREARLIGATAKRSNET